MASPSQTSFEQKEPGGPPTDSRRLAEAVSGLAWAVCFFVLVWLCAAPFTWMFAGGGFASQLMAGVLGLLAASLLASVVLPRPSGVPRRGGIGLQWRPGGPAFAGYGLALGGGAALATVGLCYAAGSISFIHEPPEPSFFELGAVPGVVASAMGLICGAFAEELFSRGYGMQQLARAVRPAGAAVVTGVGFGLLHQGNPDATPLSTLNTMLFGVLFGLAAVRSRSLWLPAGMHLGWNLALAFAGASVSGLRIKLTALTAVPAGSPLWSGGPYGPEGGLFATGAVAALGAAVWTLRLSPSNETLIWDDIRGQRGG